MLTRKLSMSLVVLSLAGSPAAADSLTEGIQAGRMTVLRVNKDVGAFECVEHRRWTTGRKADLAIVNPGDIVRVDGKNGRPPRIIFLRSAAEELASFE
jgi:hypothetical protein